MSVVVKDWERLLRRVDETHAHFAGEFGITDTGSVTASDGKKLTVKHEVYRDDDGNKRHRFIVYDKDGAQVAHATLTRKGTQVMSVGVRPEDRRKGIASSLYDHIESRLGVKLTANWATTPDGEALWRNRDKK